MVMRRFLVLGIGLISISAVVAIGTQTAFAGSPHFVSNTVSVSRSDNSLTVSGKEAGLGDEAQVHIVVTATAACINPGDHHPKAANKESLSAAGDFPVQNGKAEFSLTVTATFQPNCTPPMTVVFSNVTVTDTTSGISKSFSGTF
jgi:hypothetical protein